MPLSAVDFHISDIVYHLLEKPEITACALDIARDPMELMRQAIWTHSSSINRRSWILVMNYYYMFLACDFLHTFSYQVYINCFCFCTALQGLVGRTHCQASGNRLAMATHDAKSELLQSKSSFAVCTSYPACSVICCTCVGSLSIAGNIHALQLDMFHRSIIGAGT